MSDKPDNPEPSKGPTIIKDDWKSPAPHPSQNGLNTDVNPRLAEDRKRRDVLDWLGDYGEEAERRIAELTEQVQQGENQRTDVGGSHDSNGKPAAGLDIDSKDKLDKLTHERESRLQSLRGKACALHAVGKYAEAEHAYQDYFNLLGDTSSDIPTLQARHECARQIEKSRKRIRWRCILVFLLMLLFGIWLWGTLSVANRTIESARIAAENADAELLSLYCNRLESPWFDVASFGAVGYMHDPEIGRWKSLIDETTNENADPTPAPKQADPVIQETVALAQPVIVESNENTRVAEEPHAPTVVTNYLNPPILSFGLAPRGTEAVVFNSDFEKMTLDHSVSILKPGERYLLLASKGGYDPYIQPFSADWQGMEYMDISLTNPRKDAREARFNESVELGDGIIQMQELLLLMEQYEWQKLKQQMRELKAGQKD